MTKVDLDLHNTIVSQLTKFPNCL